MSESTSQRNKAIWVGSLALLTVGSVLYFTLLRKPEDSSKPAKDKKSRQVVKDRSVKTSQAEVKDDIPQKGDVPQAKATVTSKEVGTTESKASPPISLLDSGKNTEQQQDTTAINNDQGFEKSPVLTAAPSSSSSSDVNPSSLGEQQEHIATNATTSATNNNANGADINGYWQPPTNNATFQHSMGWPELFPLQQQQQQQQQQQEGSNETKSAVATVNGEKATATETAAAVATTEKKKHNKKRMTRMEQIDQQRQNYVPTMKSRCNWWPNCTNKNCKYHHPYQLCRYGDMCIYNERCMFLHPWDIEEPVRQTKQQQHQLQHTAN